MLQVWESQFIPFPPLLQEDEGECMSGARVVGPPLVSVLVTMGWPQASVWLARVISIWQFHPMWLPSPSWRITLN